MSSEIVRKYSTSEKISSGGVEIEISREKGRGSREKRVCSKKKWREVRGRDTKREGSSSKDSCR